MVAISVPANASGTPANLVAAVYRSCEVSALIHSADPRECLQLQEHLGRSPINTALAAPLLFLLPPPHRKAQPLGRRRRRIRGQSIIVAAGSQTAHEQEREQREADQLEECRRHRSRRFRARVLECMFGIFILLPRNDIVELPARN